MNDDEFLSRLKKLCLEYDSKVGRWPENELEGFALYYFAQHPEYEFNYPYDKIDPDNEYQDEFDKLKEGAQSEHHITEKPNFIIHLSEEARMEIITNFFKNSGVTKKSEFFKEESPDWLADTFIIQGITQTSEQWLSGTCKITAIDELYVVNEKTMEVIENKQKHEVVELVICN